MDTDYNRCGDLARRAVSDNQVKEDIPMSECNHIWAKVFEQYLSSEGCFPIGYECEKCHKFLIHSELISLGTGGTISSREILVGPHGGCINSMFGKKYKRQIYDKETGKIEYIE